jgi:hypothetical protein
LWERAQIMSNEMKKDIKWSCFVFNKARAPWNKPSRCLQALIGESTFTNTACVTTPKAHHRINTFYLSHDKVLSEMKSWFDNNDEEILCALGDVVLNDSPLALMLWQSFTIDRDLLEVEKSMYQNPDFWKVFWNLDPLFLDIKLHGTFLTYWTT